MGPATSLGRSQIGWVVVVLLVAVTCCYAVQDYENIIDDGDSPDSIRSPRQPHYGSHGYGRPGYSHPHGDGKSYLAYYRCNAPEGYPGSCKPRSTCAHYYSSTIHYDYSRPSQYKSCNFGYGSRGVCCPEVIYTGPKPAPIKIAHYKRPGYNSHQVHVDDNAMKTAITWASEEIGKSWTHDKQYGRGEDDDSYWNNGVAPGLYLKMLNKSGWVGYYISLITWYLRKEHAYNPLSYYDGGYSVIDKYMDHLPKYAQEICSTYRQLKCSRYNKWRPIDGTCNNLVHPYWGKSYESTIRIAPPMYSDYVWAIKRGKDGHKLPVARHLRNKMLPVHQQFDKSASSLFTFFMQMVVHDGTHSTFYQTNDGMFFDCCQGYKGGEHEVHPKCSTMEVFPDDPFYGPKGVKCVNLARNIIAPNYHCSLGYSNQLSMVTPWMDLSNIYGNYNEEAQKQRTYQHGQLKMSKFGDQYLPPVDPDAECETAAPFCFGGGDLRSSQNPGLIVVQTLWTRLHNYCALKLWSYNKHWDDEFLYQECRRITIAAYQHITYEEALPLLLGWKHMLNHGMLPTTKGYSHGYNQYINPATYGEFGAAAMRCHSTVYEEVLLVDSYWKVEHKEPLYRHFNNPSIFAKHQNYNLILRGLMHSKQRKLDEYYDKTMVDHVFQRNRTHGFDIAAFNIIRGYEYGLRGYNDYREICGLKRAHTWEDFGDWIDPKNIELLRENYKYVDDVSLYTGGLMERHMYDSLMGPTWWCIVSEQFYNWKWADNWFYDLGSRPHSLSYPQLQEVRSWTMAGLICTVTDLEEVPVFPFHAVSYGNPLVKCSDYDEIPPFSFAPWKQGY